MDGKFRWTKHGNFNETIALLPGYNIIRLRAQDKFGNVRRKKLSINIYAAKMTIASINVRNNQYDKEKRKKRRKNSRDGSLG